MSASAPKLRDLVPTAAAVAKRPDLWRTAVRQAVRLAPTRWWARRPFLPLPASGYMGFRSLLGTMYGGDGSTSPQPDDVIVWLEWCRRWPSVSA